MPPTLKPLIVLAAAIAGAAALLLFGLPAWGRSGPRKVVVYTSVDSDYANALFDNFTRETGIRVEPRFDSEASKTSGMADRLDQMKDNPDGDVFWNSELSRTQVLANDGALDAYASPNAKDIPPAYKDPRDRWTGFGCRARVILFNTGLIKREDVPKTLDGLGDPRFKGRVCVPKPTFGTTQSHFVSLVLALGEEKAFKLFNAWHDNGVAMVESNSDVRTRVSQGFFAFGLTDSDDAFEALAGNNPVDFIVPDQSGDWHGAYLVPNTVSILKHCRRPEEAKIFVDYLLRPGTESWLSQHGAHQIPVRNLPGVKPPIPLGDLKPASVDVEQLGKSVRAVGERILRIWEK